MANTAQTAARRKAESAMAKRAEQFHHREQALRETIGDYFDASEQAEKTRAAAVQKAEKLLSQTHERITVLREQAEAAAGEHERHADTAISRLLKLGENPKSIAETLEISLTRIKEIQRPTPQPRQAKASTN
jgi:hypothetical protein